MRSLPFLFFWSLTGLCQGSAPLMETQRSGDLLWIFSARNPAANQRGQEKPFLMAKERGVGGSGRILKRRDLEKGTLSLCV